MDDCHNELADTKRHWVAVEIGRSSLSEGNGHSRWERPRCPQRSARCSRSRTSSATQRSSLFPSLRFAWEIWPSEASVATHSANLGGEPSPPVIEADGGMPVGWRKVSVTPRDLLRLAAQSNVTAVVRCIRAVVAEPMWTPDMAAGYHCPGPRGWTVAIQCWSRTMSWRHDEYSLDTVRHSRMTGDLEALR